MGNIITKISTVWRSCFNTYDVSEMLLLFLKYWKLQLLLHIFFSVKQHNATCVKTVFSVLKFNTHMYIFVFTVAPLCFLYKEPVTLYYVFREMYTRYFFRLHSISSHSQVSWCKQPNLKDRLFKLNLQDKAKQFSIVTCVSFLQYFWKQIHPRGVLRDVIKCLIYSYVKWTRFWTFFTCP